MLFQAGIPPVEGMAILQSDAQSPEGKAIFEEILTVCRQGESFHKALEATKVFPDYCLHMIALGEESGNLDVCMSSLADYYEKRGCHRRQYPGCCNISLYHDRHDGRCHRGTGQPRHADLRAGLYRAGQ